ncbi:MAG TPA: peptidase domain-containing ABC transporter [Holophagaceae bacterium]|nr:peptidase domain-containing ABC transporter [Holophagaceae bacterium]
MDRLRPRRKAPFIPQMEAVECGAASLAMVLGYHGHHAPLVEVRHACGVSRDGASALALLRAARGFGLEAEAVKVELEHLDDLPVPAILHWDFNHFLVLERLTAKGAVLVDPALGRRKVDLAELQKRFTGVALVFAPGEDFTPRPRRRPSLGRYVALLKASRPSLGQLLGASIMLQVVGLAFPVANQLLLDRVITPRQEPWLWGLAFGLAAATLGKVALSLLRAWVIQGLQTNLDLHLMGSFMAHLLHLPLGFFLQRAPGDLVQRVQSNAHLRDFFSSRSIAALLDAFLILGYAALMLAYSPRLGTVVLAFGLLRVGLLLALRERNQQIMAAELAASGREGGSLVEALSALETLKAVGAEGALLRRWTDRMVNRVNASLQRRELEITSAQGMALFQGLAAAAVLWIGGREVLAERMTVGVFASFIALQGLFMGPLESLLGAATQLQYLGNHLSRLDDVMEAAPEATGGVDPGRLKGAIELEDVAFAYTPGAPPVVAQIHIALAPGEKVALVGPSGAGKSTLARLLLGMHHPTAGSIRFDGRDLRELDLPKLRNQMGVVLQDTFLFDDTVRANLSLNDPELPLERLRWAAEQACVLDVIEALPLGFEARVGENGGLLSGGQRQRLALARALAHDPAVLLLDEATSALDLETEAKLHANLAALGCTRIVIAHRLATVKDADRILMLEGGRLVQSGTYAALRASAGPFRTLVDAMEVAHG